ncbi:MAG: YqeG family HAD IIIA-type phosphatase [Thermoanaerobacteraceae bacterium]|nr:YqeG family HAD IIIA-type phosphatase [Thermoanaerobacteraceae bacterium]
MILFPDMYLNSIDDLNIKELKQRGFKAIIIDIDNTIIEWNVRVPDERTRRIINEALSEGMRVCLLSNGTKDRVTEFAKALNVPYVYNAGKPRKSPYKKALKLLDVKPEEVAAIGDQIFTDVLGGNRLGLYTILVRPISTNETGWTRFMRRFEKLVLDRYNKNALRNF